MARKRGCSYGRRRNGRCPAKKSRRRGGGLSGMTRTCTRYSTSGRGKSAYMRCVSYVDTRGIPPYRGQRKGIAQGVFRSPVRSISHGRL